MSQKRTSSKIKQKQQQTKLLEQQTKRMQQKLAALKQQVEQQKKLKQSSHYQSTLTKWKKATHTQAPLKDYAKKVLADRKEALNKYGINQKKIFGSKSFQPVLTKIKSQKRQQQQRQGTKIPKFEVTSIIQRPPSSSSQQPKPSPLSHPSPQQITTTASVQNNLFKAKINTKQIIHRKTLQQFMEQNFLQMYMPVLKANNVHDLEDLYHLSREQMVNMGIKSGHQAKIVKRIAEEFSAKAGNNGDVQEKSQSKQEQKVSFGYGDGDINEYSQLNSQQAHTNQAPPEAQPPSSQQQQSQANSSQNQDQVILTQPQLQQYSIQTQQEQQKTDKIPLSNIPCFQCYKKFSHQPQISTDNRYFCTQLCLNKYLQFMQKVCPECDQQFYKFDGYCEEGLWFCSIKCSPNRECIQEMFINWNKQRNANS